MSNLGDRLRGACLIALQHLRPLGWRPGDGLHRLGGLYIGPSVCLLSHGPTEQRVLDQIADGVRSAGGVFDVLVIDSFAQEAQALLVNRFNSARDAEYAEVVERAQAMEAELEREGERGKFTFAEVEENEADLGKLKRWLETLGTGDLFGAFGRGPAEQAARVAAGALQRFAERAARLEEETPP
jgi:hypothetical protein